MTAIEKSLVCRFHGSEQHMFRRMSQENRTTKRSSQVAANSGLGILSQKCAQVQNLFCESQIRIKEKKKNI